MEFKDLSCLIGKRELAAVGIVAGAFAVLLVMQLAVWSFVTVAVLFIVYASWRTTAFVVDQQHYSGRSLSACIWPVGIAVVQVAAGLALAWVGVWLARLVFHI